MPFLARRTAIPRLRISQVTPQAAARTIRISILACEKQHSVSGRSAGSAAFISGIYGLHKNPSISQIANFIGGFLGGNEKCFFKKCSRRLFSIV